MMDAVTFCEVDLALMDLSRSPAETLLCRTIRWGIVGSDAFLLKMKSDFEIGLHQNTVVFSWRV